MEVDCANGCGRKIQLEIPEDDGLAARMGRALAKRVVCDPCLEATETRLERERGARMEAERLSGSGLPYSLRNLTWDHWRGGGAAVEAAEGWAARVPKPRGLLLSGDVGVGKTWLAATATRAALRYRNVRWVSAAKLMLALRSGHGEDERKEANRLLAGAGALVIDDLDKASGTDYGKEVVFALIDGRIEEDAPLVVTTNLSLDALAERYGRPIASRLAGYCQAYQMTGADRRLSVG